MFLLFVACVAKKSGSSVEGVVSQDVVEPVKEEYEKRILNMREMFENGKRYENDWWEDHGLRLRLY